MWECFCFGHCDSFQGGGRFLPNDRLHKIFYTLCFQSAVFLVNFFMVIVFHVFEFGNAGSREIIFNFFVCRINALFTM